MAGFEHLGLAEVLCYTLQTNRAPRRVMEKAGFGYERDVVHAGLPYVFHCLTASGRPEDRRWPLTEPEKRQTRRSLRI